MSQAKKPTLAAASSDLLGQARPTAGCRGRAARAAVRPLPQRRAAAAARRG